MYHHNGSSHEVFANFIGSIFHHCFSTQWLVWCITSFYQANTRVLTEGQEVLRLPSHNHNNLVVSQVIQHAFMRWFDGNSILQRHLAPAKSYHLLQHAWYPLLNQVPTRFQKCEFGPSLADTKLAIAWIPLKLTVCI